MRGAVSWVRDLKCFRVGENTFAGILVFVVGSLRRLVLGLLMSRGIRVPTATSLPSCVEPWNWLGQQDDLHHLIDRLTRNRRLALPTPLAVKKATESVPHMVAK